MNKVAIIGIWKALLTEIGEDIERLGLQGTPTRIAMAYKELFCGYDKRKKPHMTVLRNHRDGIRSAGLLRDSGYYFSMCEHHVLPFFGEYYFGYVPHEFVLGVSKINRTVDFHAARLQVAERLCYDVIQDIEERVKPLGSILIMNGRHMCKEMRGVKKFNSPYEVSEARGIFFNNTDGIKDEFLARLPR